MIHIWFSLFFFFFWMSCYKDRILNIMMHLLADLFFIKKVSYVKSYSLTFVINISYIYMYIISISLFYEYCELNVISSSLENCPCTLCRTNWFSL